MFGECFRYTIFYSYHLKSSDCEQKKKKKKKMTVRLVYKIYNSSLTVFHLCVCFVYVVLFRNYSNIYLVIKYVQNMINFD